MRQNTPEKFWSRVKIGTPEECWEWQGATASGYGRVHWRGRVTAANRLAWELTHGSIPDGLLACHRCDNKRCVNPAHLFLGTSQDNSRDMVVKGRSMAGRNPCAKLNAEQVTEIRQLRASGRTLQSIADQFGVNLGTVRALIDGRSWRTVPLAHHSLPGSEQS